MLKNGKHKVIRTTDEHSRERFTKYKDDEQNYIKKPTFPFTDDKTNEDYFTMALP